jgi:hypothetical protein
LILPRTTVTLTCSEAESYGVNRVLSELTGGNLFQGLLHGDPIWQINNDESILKELQLMDPETSSG